MFLLNEVNEYTIPLSHCSVILQCIKFSYKLSKQLSFINWLFCFDLQCLLCWNIHLWIIENPNGKSCLNEWSSSNKMKNKKYHTVGSNGKITERGKI